MKFNIQYIAWIAVLLAVLAWVGVWRAGNSILDEAAARAANASSAQAQSDRAAYTQRVAALVADTKPERDLLDDASGRNIVSIVTMIEGIGAKSGVSVKVKSAQPQGSPTVLSGGVSLSKFAFVAEADGSFAQVMRTLQALETLPLPSSIDQIEMIEGGEGKDHTWHLNVRVGVLTTSTGS